MSWFIGIWEPQNKPPARRQSKRKGMALPFLRGEMTQLSGQSADPVCSALLHHEFFDDRLDSDLVLDFADPCKMREAGMDPERFFIPPFFD